MLLMSGLLYAVHQFVYAAIHHSLPDNLKLVFDYVHIALYVLLPVTGWVAESWLGRYRAIAVGLVLTLAATLTLQAAFVLLQFDWSPIPAFVVIVVGLAIGTFGFGSFYSIMIPFALDQMIGASAEEISATVQIQLCSVGNWYKRELIQYSKAVSYGIAQQLLGCYCISVD